MRQRLIGTLLLLLASCDPAADGTYQGYVEGEYVTVAAPLGGRVMRLAVDEGARVKKGELLFELDPTAERAQLTEANQRASGDAGEAGASSSQLAAFQAARDQAKADHDLAVAELKRARRLSTGKVIDQATLDQATAREAATAARLRQAMRNIEAAAATSRAANAVVTQAAWRLSQMTGVAPADGLVILVARREGEWVAPGGRGGPAPSRQRSPRPFLRAAIGSPDACARDERHRHRRRFGVADPLPGHPGRREGGVYPPLHL